MVLLGLCPMIFGIGLSLYALSGNAADDAPYLMVGIAAAVIGTLVIVVLWALIPMVAGAMGV
jgi:hypothetical protein